MNRVVLFLMLAATAVFAEEWTGYVSDAKCGAKHVDGSEASIKCVTSCIKGGAKPVLIVDGKVVAVDNADAVPADLYGKKVTVSGEMTNDTVHITKIAAAEE